MMPNHEEWAKQNPEPYRGQIIRPKTPQADGEQCSVIEAADYYDLPPILARFGDWAICEDGLHCLYVDYHIPRSRFHEPDWVEHITEKTWVDPQDFIAAFNTAKGMAGSGKI